VTTFAQRSFSSGEISPSLYARVDQVKYATGLRVCRNFIVMRHGGVSNRPGTKFVGEVKDSSKSVRLIPFIFNAAQTYVLEFGDLYMRVHQNGAQVLEGSVAITGATQANPCVITAIAHGFSNGDEVAISGILGMTQLNGRNFKVANVALNTFELRYMDGATTVNSASFGAYISGGSARRVFTLATPYLEADLPELQFVQSADVITIVHPGYAPRELARTGLTSWTLSIVPFAPSVNRPANVAVAAGGAGALTFRYKVTAIRKETYEESLSGTEAADVITNVTQANPAVVTAAGHGYANGDEVLITGVGGMTELNGRTFIVDNVTVNDFELKDTDSTGYGAYTAGGSSLRTSAVITAAAAPTTGAPHVLTWDAVADAVEYNIYKEINGLYGFVAVAQTNTFSDTGLTPDDSDNPPQATNLFKLDGDFPSTVGYFQQRRCFANTDNDPDKFFASRTAEFGNFTTHSPLQDDDAVIFKLVGRQVNEIRHILDVGNLVLLTSGGEWTIEGDPSGILTPVDINPKQRGYNGASDLPPIVVGGNALYVQARGSIVRDLSFDYQVENYRGNDLTIFAAHLFDGFTLRDWTFQQIPHSIVWSARNDGALLGLTYVREHQIVGWHRHDTQDGIIEQVCAIPEGDEDALYCVVKRTIPGLAGLGGSTRRYIERLATRRVEDIKDSFYVDSGLTYDGRHLGSITMTLTGGTTWDYTETLTLTASSAAFSASDVGNAVHLTGADGTLIRFTIDSFSSATVVLGRAHKTVPPGMRAVAITTWALAVDQITGLWHLEGQDISVLGDGFVVGNPNNAAYDTRTIANGAVALDKPYAVIHAGLPITADLETLDMDTASGETMADKKKLISRVTLFMESSRGLFIGPALPTEDSSQAGMDELKIRNAEDYDDPIRLLTETADVNIQPTWNSNGRIAIRQTDPLPVSVLAVAPSGLIPLRG
jgi:hypothetical protein